MKISSIIILTLGMIISLTTNGDEKLQKISGILDKTNKNKNLLKINKNFSLEVRGEMLEKIPNGSRIIVRGAVHLTFHERKITDEDLYNINTFNDIPIQMTVYMMVKQYKVLKNISKAKWKKQPARHVLEDYWIVSSEMKIKSILISNKNCTIHISWVNDSLWGVGYSFSGDSHAIPKDKSEELKYCLTSNGNKNIVSIRVRDDFELVLDNYKIIYSEMKNQRNEVEANADLLKLWKILTRWSDRFHIDGIQVKKVFPKKLPPKQQAFVDKFISAYKTKDKDAMLKMIHPKCVALYKSKNAYSKLINIAMRTPEDRKNLVFKIARLTPTSNIPKDQYLLGMDKFLIYPVKATHFMSIRFKNGFTIGRSLVYEDDKFYITFPYAKKGLINYLKHGTSHIIKEESNKKNPELRGYRTRF